MAKIDNVYVNGKLFMPPKDYTDIPECVIEPKRSYFTLYRALELAVEQLEDAKEMLREAGKNDWANTLDISCDYFIARAKSEKEREDAEGSDNR